MEMFSFRPPRNRRPPSDPILHDVPINIFNKDETFNVCIKGDLASDRESYGEPIYVLGSSESIGFSGTVHLLKFIINIGTKLTGILREKGHYICIDNEEYKGRVFRVVRVRSKRLYVKEVEVR